MKFTLASYCLLAAFFCSHGARIQGDELFDELIEQLRDADEIRVMPLDDFSIGFNRKVAIVDVRGEAKLYDGSVVGLETAERIDDARIITQSDGTVRIKCTLSMGVIEFYYKGTVTFMGLGPAIKMQTHTGYVTVNAEIERLPDGTVKVTQFDLKNFEKLKVNFTGLSTLTWAASILSAPVISFLTPVIKKIVEFNVRKVVEKKLPKIIAHFNFE